MRQPLYYTPELGSRLRAAAPSSARPIWLRPGTPKHEVFAAFPSRTLLYVEQPISPESEDATLAISSWPDFWRALMAEARNLPLQSGLEDLPYRGGLMGFLGYEAFADSNGQPFPTAYMGVYPRFVHIDHIRRTAEIVHVLDAGEADEQWSDLIESVQCITKPPQNRHSFGLTQDFVPLTSPARYKSDIERIQRYLHQGDCYQVNYAQAFLARCKGASADAMDILLEASDPAYAAWMSLPQGDILSLSPEMFLRIQDGDIESRPIKGTTPRSPDPAMDARLREELAASPKNRAENLMIVDLIRHDIGKHADIGSVAVEQLFEVESLPNVHHLVSTVSARLRKDSTVLELIRDAFPGGSITGAPKKRAMEIIAELETTPRSVYCGSIGYINGDGSALLNIAIRTLLRMNDELYAWAGGGIVADSDWESEYRECFDKMGALMGALEKSFGRTQTED